MARQLTYTQAVNEAIHQAMEKDENVICYGLGTDDPKGVFGTTLGLQEAFGEDRVFDMPTSENAMTGVAIGAALNGIRSVVTHQRLDFFLLAMDQLVNNAAKWHYMFGGKSSVPITIRLIIGRGWGQGPTHSQNLQAWFAHIPGLKVLMPTTPYTAKGLLCGAIEDKNPVIFLEHRWLHNQSGDVPEEYYALPPGKCRLVKEGDDITIVALSYMVAEAIHANETLKQNGVSCEIIDLQSISPIDWQTIIKSVSKTGRLLVLDTASRTGSVAGEIIAEISSRCFTSLKNAPQRLALPDVPTPTSQALTAEFYNRANEVVTTVANILSIEIEKQMENNNPLDVPGDWFKGPF